MKMRRWTAGLACVLATLIALTGCGGSGSTGSGSGSGGAPKASSDSGGAPAKAGEPVKITFWDENPGPNRTPFYDELIKRFEQANPNIKIEYVGIPASSNKQKYDVAITSGDTPDVADVSSQWIADFAMKGALLPLDDYFDKWKDKDQILAQQIQYNRDLVPDKKLYQIPNTMNITLLWYRSDWVKEAGLKPIENWDDFFTTVKALTDQEKHRYGFSIRGGPGATLQLDDFLFNYSGIDRYFDENGKSTVNNPKHVEFLKKYVALYKTYTPASDITNGYKEMVATFDSGTAAMIQHNLGSYQDHLKALGKDKFSAAMVPIQPSGSHIVHGGNNGYGIFKSTKHPDEAWKFLSFLCSAESQAYWNENIGQLPANSESYKNDFFTKTDYLKLSSSVLEDKTTKVLARPEYLPDWAAITKQTDDNFQKLLSGKMSPEEFLKTFAEALDKSKADYDKAMKNKK